MGVRLREGILDVGLWIGAEITHAKGAKPRLWSGRRRGMQRSTGRGEGGVALLRPACAGL